MAPVGTPASTSRASRPAPIIPASGPMRAASTRTTSLPGASARSSMTSRAGASSSSPAAITPPPITITCGLKMFTRLTRPMPSARPIVSIAPRATGSPAVASSVISGPVSSRPSSSAWPSAVSGWRATASDASRTSAVPEATDSRQPQFGQLPWHGRPFMSTIMWPISAPPMIQPR